MFRRIRNISLIAGAMLLAVPCSGITLPELEKSYESKCSEILNTKKESLDSLRTSYLGALKRIENKYQRAGRLDEVLLVKEESKSIEEGKWPLSSLPEKISLDTAAPRKIYLRKHIEITQQAAKDLVQTTDTMTKALDAQVASLTKAGDLTNAKLAQTIRDGLDQDPDISAARKLVDNVRSDGSSRPALRIRRAGDNIEVLVNYDMRGKVSLDSPLTNLEESDKSIGDTSAKVLGEFIGADGYEVDPNVIFEKTFDDDAAGGITMSEIEPKFKFSIEDESGMALLVADNPQNANMSIPAEMPAKAIGGTTTITCRYLIPKSNGAVTGFLFIQGMSGGNPFGGENFTTTGKWVTQSVTSEPLSEETRLLLYPKIEAAKKPAKPGEASIVFATIKVEQSRFSAFVIQRLGQNGVIAEEFKDAPDQPKLADNGKLASE